MKYNKLVRDKIPDIIKQKGSTPIIKIADDEEYLERLIEKFKEESDEFLKEFSEEELADLLEVIYAICDFQKIDTKRLEILRKEKSEKRGAFKNKIILKETK
ncbi:nucleoside triphosphate pyrophosphohydrolase [Candidatus Woesearchaeota archaeon]|nr:nucleoside triphosphate pyrophosphohydrolase [Candidatus Woesearchaeota archaeon]